MSKSSDYPNKKRFDLTATIAISTTTSALVDLVGTDLVAIHLPAAMTGVAISFQASVDGANFFAVNDGVGAAVSITTAANQIIPVPAYIHNFRWVKLVSGSTELAARTIGLITRAS